jgi:hypothetical protein
VSASLSQPWCVQVIGQTLPVQLHAQALDGVCSTC